MILNLILKIAKTYGTLYLQTFSKLSLL